MNKKQGYREMQRFWLGRESPPPLPKHYNIKKVQRLYQEIYGAEVRKIPRHYKSRCPYELYSLTDMESGEVLIEKTTLYALGQYLDSQGEYS